MSLLKRVGKIVGRASRVLPGVGPAISGGLNPVAAGVGAIIPQLLPRILPRTVPGLPRLPPLPPRLPPGPPRGGLPIPVPTPNGSPSFPVVGRDGALCCPPGFHPAKDGSGRCVRNRRMDPCNPKAIRRAARRIKSFRRLASKVERSLPTRTVRARRPRGGAHTH